MKNLSGKKVVVFNTARFTGGKSLEYMKEKVEENGAHVIDHAKFRKFLMKIINEPHIGEFSHTGRYKGL